MVERRSLTADESFRREKRGAPIGMTFADESAWLKWVCEQIIDELNDLDKDAAKAAATSEIPELKALLDNFELLLQPDGAAERQANIRDLLVSRALANLEDDYSKATRLYPSDEFKALFREHWFEYLLANFQYAFKKENEVEAAFMGKLMAGVMVKLEEGAQSAVSREWLEQKLDGFTGDWFARMEATRELLEAQGQQIEAAKQQVLLPLLALERDTNTRAQVMESLLAELKHITEQGFAQTQHGITDTRQDIADLKDDIESGLVNLHQRWDADKAVQDNLQQISEQGFAETQHSVDALGHQVDKQFDDLRRKMEEERAAREALLVPLTQLRAAVRDFVGRKKQIAQLKEALKNGGCASISSINGMGGIGKTELAIYVANELRGEYPDGQVVIDLRGTTDPLTPSQALENCIRPFVSPEARLPDDEADLRDLYARCLSGKRALIVLDNAANDKQILPLLPPAGCALLVTSREKIALPGAFHLKLDELSPDEAQQLLGEIFKRGVIAESVARRICQLCGHLPLAIRAAGSLLEVTEDLTPEEYEKELSLERTRLEKLGDQGVPLGVAASFNLSYANLSDAAAQVFCNLAVFPATFTAEAAETVCEDEGHRQLSDLLRRSLALFNEETRRYRMHDLLRLFADGKLTDDARRYTLQKRHAEFYVELLSRADDLYLTGNESTLEGLSLYDSELANIRAGQAWAATVADKDDDAGQMSIRYPDAGVYVLSLRQHPREGIEWLTVSIAAAKRLKDRRGEGNALGNLGLAYAALGEARKAIELYEQHLVIAREIGDRRGEGNALFNSSLSLNELGERAEAIARAEAALSIYEEIESPTAARVRARLADWRDLTPDD